MPVPESKVAINRSNSLHRFDPKSCIPGKQARLPKPHTQRPFTYRRCILHLCRFESAEAREDVNSWQPRGEGLGAGSKLTAPHALNVQPLSTEPLVKTSLRLGQKRRRGHLLVAALIWGLHGSRRMTSCIPGQPRAGSKLHSNVLGSRSLHSPFRGELLLRPSVSLLGRLPKPIDGLSIVSWHASPLFIH
jgi:hypothetical protein